MIKNNERARIFFNYSCSILRILIGLLFLYSGISKFTGIVFFRYSIITLKLFAFNLTEIITYTIPSIEIILGLLFVIGLFVRFTAIHLNVLIIGFSYICYHAIQISLGNCNCLGAFVKMNYGYYHFVILLILFILNTLIALNKNNFWSLDKLISKNKKIGSI